MQPQQPTYGGNFGTPSPAPPPSQYDFILNSHKHSSYGWLKGAPSQTKLLLILVGVLLGLFGLWAVAAIFSGGSNDAARLTALAQEQAEMIRISQSAIKQAASSPTQNLAANVSVSMGSDQQTLLAYMQTHNAPVPSAQVLAQHENTAGDRTLQAATNNGTYDQVYRSLIGQELQVYAQSLTQTFNLSHNQNERAILHNAYAAAQLLITQSKQS